LLYESEPFKLGSSY
jgi:hypothetical protein